MTIALRQTVADARSLCLWAAAAQPGAQVLYHIGNIAADRLTNQRLHDLADTVGILARQAYLIAHQRRISLAHIQGFSYVAVRTGEGRAPQSILHGRITPTVFIALDAVARRCPDVSAQRAIRDAMACPESVAREILAGLIADGLLEEAQIKGWQLSASGREKMM